MGIIINGMDMPKNEELWIRIQPDGKIVSQTGYVIEDASAKQVPPHGRLIDADALHYSRLRIYHEDGTVGGYNAVVMSAEIKDAPTIIEAEGERE